MEDFVITVLGREITEEQMASVATRATEQGLVVRSAERAGAPSCIPASAALYECVRIFVSGEADRVASLRHALAAFGDAAKLDINCESERTYGMSRRLLAIDLDSTLIQVEVIDELAKLAGVGEQVSRVTEAAMRGELDFKQSFTNRLALLRGLPAEKVAALLERIPLGEGVEALFAGLKQLGVRTAILSGGFTFVGQRVQARLGIDHVVANTLEIVDGKVTGRVFGEIVDGARKKEALAEIAAKFEIPLEQTVAIGDGANDLPMLGLAGMGIAYHAKPLVQQSARFAINHLGLDAVLYLIA